MTGPASYSRGPRLVLAPEQPRLVSQWLPRAAELAPRAGVRVLLDTERSVFLSYPDLLARAEQAGALLRDSGVAAGAHAVLQLPCSAEYFVAVWACLLTGVRPITIACPDDYRAPGPVLDKLVAVWQDLGRPVLLTTAAARQALAQAPALAGAHVLDLTCGPARGELDIARQFPGAAVAGRPDSDDPALAHASSGSTGRPKIVTLTHRALLEQATAAHWRPGIRRGDVTFNWLPLDNSGAFLLYHLAGVFNAATTVHAPTELITGDPLRLLDILQRHRVTHAWWPNFGFKLLTDLIVANPDRTWDLSAARTLLNAGEQCTLPVVDGFLAATRRFGVTESMLWFAWGMTETATGITFTSLDEPGTVRDGRIGVGTPDPGAELRIVGDGEGPGKDQGQDRVLPQGEIGRLQVRSARVTPGYLNDPGANERAFVGDGWFDTGDLAVMHGPAVTITGRASELIILYGRNHMATDIESALAGLGRPVAACGVPDPATGTERLVVFVADANADRNTLARSVRQTLATRRHILNAFVVVLPRLPVTTGGKIRRSLLRERFLDGSLTPVAEDSGRPAAGNGQQVGQLVAQVLSVPAEQVPADRPFYELGLSSIQLARLHELLRGQGHQLPRTALFEHPTVERLAAHLASGAESRPAPAPARTPAGADRRIAIIGMTGRFPGAPTLEQFWANLRAGVCSIRHFDASELAAGAAPDLIAAAATLDAIDEFDAEFFGISAREAALTDPAQRLFLQCCQHALEHGGYGGATAVGVFAGCGMNLYPGHRYVADLGADDDPLVQMQAAIGSQPDFLATRVSYRLGLTGPALSVQTACSTALVAVHLAARSLLAGECELALAGAAAVHVPQVTGYRHVDGSILSATGRCRPFDADADGTVGGSGVAAVLLKPLAAALADGDTVHAVLLASAVGNDGATKVSFTAPSVTGQARTIRDALEQAGAPAESIGYVEAHGTGTALGDPIEVTALTRVFREHTGRVGFCGLGSVKANIGHLDSAAGMAGLLKVVLMLGAGELPPQINFGPPNPELGLAGSPFVVHPRRRAWPVTAGPRRAGVTALGVGGTNAHVIVEQAPVSAGRAARTAPLGVLPISARSPAALAELAGDYQRWLRTAGATADLADLQLTAGAGRTHHSHRLVAHGHTPHELADSLDAAADRVSPLGPAGLAFAFAGQGAGRPGMAAQLCRRFDVFAAVVDECGVTGPLTETAPGDQTPWDTAVAQPAMFAYQVGLAALWRSWGVQPRLVFGHSAGEYAALCVAGALSVRDGARLTAARGRLMRSHCPAGAMVAVQADRPLVDSLLRALGCQWELAVVSGPDRHVLAGPAAEVPALLARLRAQRLAHRRLPVDLAFHTAAMDGVLSELAAELATVTWRPLTVAFATTAGDSASVLAPGTVPDSQYCLRQTREVARFDLALAAAAGRAVLELGPPGALGRPPGWPSWVASQPRGADPLTGLARALGQLYRAGAQVDWAAVAAGCGGRRIPLPLYPFRRDSHWAAQRPAPQNPPVQRSVREGTQVSPVVLDQIRQLVATRLGVPVDAVPAGRPLVELGADSLTMVAVVGDLDRSFGVRPSMRAVLAEGGCDCRHLAELVAAAGPPAAERPAATPPVVISQPVAPGPVVRAEPVAAARPVATRPAPGDGAVNGADTPVPAAEAVGVSAVLDRQLAVMSEFAAVMHRQLDVLTGARPQPVGPTAVQQQPVEPAAVRQRPPGRPPVTPTPAVPTTRPLRDHPAITVPPAGTCEFSVYFFGDYPQDDPGEPRYATVIDAARFADEHGFHAVWLPERHFHSFGGIFPNPSVLAAALAGQTSRIRLHAGSVVLPLHHPIRVAEEWSVVDNLSGGRAGLCVASGWHANDFVLGPQHYGRHQQVMYEHLDTVRTLWSGDAIRARSGSGEDVEVRLYPRPVQDLPPLYTAIVGNPRSYRQAGLRGLGVVTNLMTQDVDTLAANLAGYRQARRDSGLDPDTGRVVVLLHTYLGEDASAARAQAFEPFCRYLRSSLSLFGGITNSLGFDIDLDHTPPDDVQFLLEQAYARYWQSRALIGSADSVRPVVDALLAAGVHELACFVDFGLTPHQLRGGLPHVDRLRRQYAPSTVDTGGVGVADSRRARGPGDGAPLSAAQHRLWLIHQMFTDRPMYNEPRAIGLDGELDVAALRGALAQLVAAHPALRTVFGTVDGQPWQFVTAPAAPDCPLDDCTGQDEDAAVREQLAAQSRRRFDLRAAPPLALRLLRFGQARHVLVFCAHHIISDGLSWSVLLRDLAECYRAARSANPAQLPPQPVSYLQYARQQHQRRRAGDGHLRFWLDQLAGVPTALDLPADRPRPPVMGGAGRAFFERLDPELAQRVYAFARERGGTPFMALLAGFAAMLSAFSGQRRFVLGIGVSDRPPGTEHVVGMFVETVALPVDLTGEPSFAELFDRLRAATATAYDHPGVPFDELVAALNPPRDASRNPLFQVMLEYENDAGTGFTLPDLTATLLEAAPQKAAFDLTCYLSRLPGTAPGRAGDAPPGHAGDAAPGHATGTVQVHVEYNGELFDEATVRRFTAHFAHLLDSATATPHVPLPLLPQLTGRDGATLRSWQGQITASPDRLLHQRIAEQAAARPDAVAIAGTEHVTYRQLNERANRLAWLLRRRGIGRDSVVGVCLPAGADLVIALLAVLKAGAGYLPLDPATIPARLAFQLADSAAALLITTSGQPQPATDVQLLCLDEVALPRRADDPPEQAGPDTLAYLIYTSGSTGQPKGVAVPHRGPAHVVDWYLRAHPALRTLHWTSCAFDVSVLELFATLGGGATVVTIPEPLRHDPRAVAGWLREHQVQRVGMPFTPLKYLAQALVTDPALPSLREIITIGEALTLTPALRTLLAANPQCRLHNEYGPTEASVIVSSQPVDPDGPAQPPIGRLVDHVGGQVLGPDGRAVPIGAIGELHLSGPLLARGYLGRPGQTAAAFVPDPHGEGTRTYRTGDLVRWRGDGTLQFLGRRDDQVKIRGHRVEPGEVAAVLRGLDGVADAVVLAHLDRHGEPYLAGYVVPAGVMADELVSRLVADLAAALPDHLVPRAWALLARLPVGVSGKLDRSRLPRPSASGTGQRPAERPVTELELALLRLWRAELNGTDDTGGAVGPDTDFFRAGGHSLSALRLIERVREQFGVDYPVLRFFQAPTVRAMAAQLASDQVLARHALSHAQHRLWLRHHEHPDPSVYNINWQLRLQGALDPAALGAAFDEVVASHEALRTRFVPRDGRPVAEVMAAQPGLLRVLDRADPELDQAFDLRTPPLRAALVRHGEQQWTLLLVLHHLVCDHTSLAMIMDELSARYAVTCGAPQPQPPVPVQFAEYVRWEQRALADTTERVRHWRTVLAGAALRPPLPFDQPAQQSAPAGRGQGAQHRFAVDPDVLRVVDAAAAATGSTRYVVLCAAFAQLLARITGQSDVVVMTSTTTRTSPEHASTVGMFTDALPLRVRSALATPAGLVAEVGTALFTALDHPLPLDVIVDDLEPGSPPVPTVLFTVVGQPPPTPRLPGVSATVVPAQPPGLARMAFYLTLTPHQNGLFGSAEYATDLFRAGTIQDWCALFVRLLSELAQEGVAR